MDNTMDEVKNRVGENFDEMRDGLSERTQEIREAVTGYVDENPLAAVGIAFGVGYLLSGALFSRTTFRAASYGGRFVLGRFVKQLVAGIGPGMLAAMVSGRGGESEAGSDKSATHQSGGAKGSGNGNKQQH